MTSASVPERPHLRRRTGRPPDDSFEGLRRQGIRWIEQMARFNWTDYNEHDPGITILEQLCYALTDVMYRAGFPVADYLAGANGAIDWASQGLLTPELAFPSRATTPLDYEAVIYEAVFDEIEDLQVEAQPGSGLYKVVLRLRNGEDGAPRSPLRVPELTAKVRRVFAAHRNLGEDLEEVQVVPEAEFVLEARIEIEEGADPALVLARIYSHCEQSIAGVTFRRFDLALQEGLSPEEVFRGPFTRFGVVRRQRSFAAQDPHAAPHPVTLTAQDLYRIIAEVEGVVNVMAVSEPAARPGLSGIPRLRVPQTQQELDRVVLSAVGGKARVDWHDFMMRYKQERAAARVVPHTEEELSELLPLPRGKRRALGEYQSIQNGFPAVYGIGARGHAASSPPEKKGRARQLQAWLLFFDQHLADFLAMLEHIRDLFSVNPTRTTYFSQALGADSVPGIDDLYPPCPRETLDKLSEVYDHRDRVQRLLEHFLALYGESFRDPPRGAQPAHAKHPADAAIAGRLAALQDIVRLTRDRAAGANPYEAESEDNVSGLELRLNRLLGGAAPGQERVRVVDHILLRPSSPPGAGEELSADFYDRRVTIVMARPERADESLTRFIEDAVEEYCPAHICASSRWLSAEEFRAFDAAHESWWARRRELLASPGRATGWKWRHGKGFDAATKTDEAARDLAAYLGAPDAGRT